MIFNYANFIADYPQFSTFSQSYVENEFKFGAIPMGQVVGGLFQEDDAKLYWYQVVLAHILTLQQNGLTGRVSQAGQGSESVSLDMNAPQWSSYWIQTTYGQKVYQMMQEYLYGGHYISDGEIPYLGEAMNGEYERIIW
jgi:hypothetical protein